MPQNFIWWLMMKLHNAHVLAYYSTNKGFNHCISVVARKLFKKYGVIN